MTSGKRSVTEGVALASWGALAGIDRRVTQARETEAQRRSCHQSADEHPSTDFEATLNNTQPGRESLRNRAVRVYAVRQMYVSNREVSL